ncbi:hypothetical protein [Slackia piriformis]|uniref:hypothetical protein n=1 Tax=Slackia piriformis TaxID=626934 RepID=UPI0039F44A15
MAKIVRYWAHDPVGNIENMLQSFDKEQLQKGEEAGIVFVAEYDDGTRSIVKAVDVVEPQTFSNDEDITLVLPSYVDERTSATVACFDALAEIVNPSVATVSADDAEAEVDPIKVFMAAIEKLRALKTGGDA